MLNRVPALPSALAAGLMLAAACGPEASAQAAPTPAAVWGRFVEICPAVVAAADPAAYAAGLGEVRGSFGQSPDGRIRSATLDMPDLRSAGGPSILLTFANDFDGGRSVQCTLQVLDPEDGLAGLPDLVRSQAGRVLGEDAVLSSAGGPIRGVEVSSAGADLRTSMEMLRISTEGFPPQAVLTVQLLQHAVILTLQVLQADAGQ